MVIAVVIVVVVVVVVIAVTTVMAVTAVADRKQRLELIATMATQQHNKILQVTPPCHILTNNNRAVSLVMEELKKPFGAAENP